MHAVPIADVPNAFEITGHGFDRARRRANHGFGDECGDFGGAELLDLLFELIRNPLAVGHLALFRGSLSIFEAGCNVVARDHQWCEAPTPPFVATDGQGAERIAVVALPARDKQMAIGLAGFHKVLSRQLQRRFDRFGAAAQQQHPVHTRRSRNQRLGELFHNVGCEIRGVRIRQRLDLLLDGSNDGRMIVAEAGNGRAAGTVEITLAGRVDHIGAFAAHGLRRQSSQVPVNQVTH